MADRKITAHTAITAAEVDPANDVIEIVDVSDTTDAATGTNKKITGLELKNLIPDLFSFMRSGVEHLPNMFINASDANLVLTVNQLRAVPFIITRTEVVTGISFNCTGLVASSKARLGIYTANATTYLPDTLVSGSDAVEYDTASTGVKTSGAVSITLQPGLYWLAINTSGAITVRAFASGTGAVTNVLGGSSLPATGTRPNSSWTVSNAYGTMPSTFPGGGVGVDASTLKFSLTL